MSFWPSSLGKSKQYFHSEKEVREAGSEPQLSLNISHDCELFQHMDGPEGKAVYLIPLPRLAPPANHVCNSEKLVIKILDIQDICPE